MLVEGIGSLATARGIGGYELLVVGAENYGHLHSPFWSSSFCLEEDAKDQVQRSCVVGQCSQVSQLLYFLLW